VRKGVLYLQGMIMGPRTAASMLLGAVAGYGLLGPLARSRGWAPGAIGDWETGATGWILWISLSIMLADSLTSLTLLMASTLRTNLAYKRSTPPPPEPDLPNSARGLHPAHHPGLQETPPPLPPGQ